MKMDERDQDNFGNKKKKIHTNVQAKGKRKQIYQEVSQLSNEDCYKLKEAIQMLDLMKHQYLPDKKEIQMIQLILDLFTPKGKFYAIICVYQYGVIQGKRKLRKIKNEISSH